MAVPFIAAGYVALTRTWLPPSDHALIMLHVRDVGGPDTPLLGAYSRLGWNHPGPLAFWLLALPYRLSGARTQGVMIGILAINAAAIVGCLALARRRGGTVLTVLVGLALAAMVRGFGAAFAFHVWNPDLPAYPTAFLILATWSVIEGDLRLVPARGRRLVLRLADPPRLPARHRGARRAGRSASAGWQLLRAPARRRRRDEPARGPRRGPRPMVLVAVTAVTAGVCLAPLAGRAGDHPAGEPPADPGQLPPSPGAVVGVGRARGWPACTCPRWARGSPATIPPSRSPPGPRAGTRHCWCCPSSP